MGTDTHRMQLLLADDEPVLRKLLEDDFDVVVVESFADAHRALQNQSFDICVTDRNFGDGSGLDLIEVGQDATAFVMITGLGTTESCIEALRRGFSDYILKPFDNHAVVHQIGRVAEFVRLKRSNQRLVQELETRNAVLEDLVVRDPLTRLFNHAHLHESLDREIQRANRNGESLGFLLVGVDNLQPVNDARGHMTGDRVLQDIGKILRGGTPGFRLRKQDVAARYSGDEFALILPGTRKDGASTIAERLRSAVEDWIPDEQGLPEVTVSIGVATLPDDAPDRVGLVDAAQQGLYVAKSMGRNQMVTFNPAIADARARPEVARAEVARKIALDRAITDCAFGFAYQPIVQASSGTVFAYEALCRPHGEMFRNPLDLLDAAERAGRVRQLGDVLRAVALEPRSELPEGALLFVNLHPLELTESLPEWLAAAGGPWDRVVFEVTEAARVGDFDFVFDLLSTLRALGARIAVDDLGAGYMGLNALARLRPDFVKLDRALLRDAKLDAPTKRLVSLVVEFSHGEGMTVVAEGVEDRDDWRFVRDLGCDLAQGYYFSMPAPAFCAVEVDPI